MSNSATKWAWKQKLPHLDKMVLLNLSDRANENFECWPSMQTIANDCGICRKSVFNSLVKLEQNNFISIERRITNYGKSSNIYTINIAMQKGKTPCVRGTHPDVTLVHIEPTSNYLESIPY